MRSWVIGSRADCDVVVDSPLASGRHCELTQTPEGYVLNDLGSTNGTFVNGLKIESPTRINTGDSITLGRTVPLPWPPDVMRSIRIGRLADNHIVLDDVRVSGHHARLIVVAGSPTLIEDTGSSNGTFLNSADRRVTSPTAITESDTLFFGTLAVPAARLLDQIKEAETPAPLSAPVTAVCELIQAPAPTRPATSHWERNRWLLAWSGQVPVLAIVIVAISGRQAAATVNAANWASVGQAIASVTFALALAAVWLGCSLAVAELADGRSPRSQAGVDPASFLVSFGSRLGTLAALCAVACALLLPIAYWGSGLKGPWMAMWSVLFLASLIGLLLGLVVSAVVPNWAGAAILLLIGFVPMVALGGWFRPLPEITSPPVRLAAEAVPSRWAFEALFLLEATERPAPIRQEGADPTQGHDFVEDFFPANSQRMGPRADAMALGSMVIGLAALAAFIAWENRSGGGGLRYFGLADGIGVLTTTESRAGSPGN